MYLEKLKCLWCHLLKWLALQKGQSETDWCWPLFWGKHQAWKSKLASPLLIDHCFAKFRQVSCIRTRVTPFFYLFPGAWPLSCLYKYLPVGQACADWTIKQTPHRISKWECSQLFQRQKATSLPSSWTPNCLQVQEREEINELGWAETIDFFFHRQRNGYRQIYVFLFLKIRRQYQQ